MNKLIALALILSVAFAADTNCDGITSSLSGRTSDADIVAKATATDACAAQTADSG